MKKLLPIANIVALLLTIAINYLSNSGFFNGETIAAISARYPALFTPAGYAFSIWGLIYLGLAGFVIFQGRALSNKPEAMELVDQVGWWFVLSCIANSCWVLAWLYGYTGFSILIMLLLLFSLSEIILRTDMELTDPPFRIILFVWWPFCIYTGWITVALLADIAAWMVKMQWSPLGLSETTWAIIMLFTAGAIHLFATWRRNMREFAMTGVWALIAVGVANRDRASSVALVAFITAGILFISSSIHGFINRKTAPWRKRDTL